MKKFLYSVLAFVAVLAGSTACQQEQKSDASDAAFVDVSFNVGLSGLQTKAFADGTTVNNLQVLVYEAKDDGSSKYLPNVSTTVENAFADGPETVALKFVKGMSYQVVFWAQYVDAAGAAPYTVDALTHTLTMNTEGLVANDETRDAFWKVVETGIVTKEGVAQNVELKRPLAQLNLFSSKEDWDAAVANEVNFTGSAMTVTAPTVLDLIGGGVSEPKDLVFAVNAIDEETIFEAGSKYVGMNYILAGEKSELEKVTFEVDRDGNKLTDVEVADVPFQRNFRTNIAGNVFSADGNFVVTVSEGFDGIHPVRIAAETQVVPVENVEAAFTGVDVDVQADPETGAITLTVEEGEENALDFSQVRSSADAAPASYESSEPTVGYFSEEEGKEGTFIPVAPGQTVVTLHYDAAEVTKATEYYNPASVSFTVVVEEGEEPVEPVEEDFSSNVELTKGSNCYDDNVLNVNGVQKVNNLKFGTGSKYGEGTVTLPAGTTNVSFYAIAWKGAPASLKFTVGESVFVKEIAANDGATSSGPYNVTVTNSDKYIIEFASALTSETEVKVETFAGENAKGYRVFLFAVNAETGAVEPQPEPELYPIKIDEVEGGTIIVKSGNEVLENGAQVLDGTQITLSYELAENYEFKEWNVTDSNSDPIEVIDDQFTMPKSGVTISATFEKQEVPVEPQGNDGSLEHPFTVAEALDLINVMTDGAIAADPVYVSGVIVSIDELSTSYGNATYNIGDALTAESTVKVFRGRYLGGQRFTAEDQIQVGDAVVVLGKLQKYVKDNVVTPELATGSTLYSLNDNTTVPDPAPYKMAVTTNPAKMTYNVNEAFDPAGMVITATLADETTKELTAAEYTSDAPETFTEAGTVKITFTLVANNSITTSLNVTVKAAEQPGGEEPGDEPGATEYFVKVTSSDDLAEGDYLIVYETGGVAFNGALETLDAVSNTISVEINSDIIDATDATKAAVFSIAAVENGYSVKSASGLFIGQDANANGLKSSRETAYVNTISFDGGNVLITSAANPVLKYNSASNQTRFRYYKSGQQDIQLYKLVKE